MAIPTELKGWKKHGNKVRHNLENLKAHFFLPNKKIPAKSSDRLGRVSIAWIDQYNLKRSSKVHLGF